MTAFRGAARLAKGAHPPIHQSLGGTGQGALLSRKGARPRNTRDIDIPPSHSLAIASSISLMSEWRHRSSSWDVPKKGTRDRTAHRGEGHPQSDSILTGLVDPAHKCWGPLGFFIMSSLQLITLQLPDCHTIALQLLAVTHSRSNSNTLQPYNALTLTPPCATIAL